MLSILKSYLLCDTVTFYPRFIEQIPVTAFVINNLSVNIDYNCLKRAYVAYCFYILRFMKSIVNDEKSGQHFSDVFHVYNNFFFHGGDNLRTDLEGLSGFGHSNVRDIAIGEHKT